MVESSLLRLSALFSTSLDPSNDEMSDRVGWLLLSYLPVLLVNLFVCSIIQISYYPEGYHRVLPINLKIL